VKRLGLITPIVTLNPRAHNEWEAAAGLDELVEIARAADRLGYHHLTCSEHVAVPEAAAASRGSRYWDPAVTLGYLAACTDRIRLATHVVVLGYHHPLEVVKRYGTLDLVSGERLILGVGVGSLREEFELLDAAFIDRGPRADDALRALRAAFGQPEPGYHGDFYDFEGFVVDPTSPRTDVAIWVGGRSARSLRRAVELADGWVPFGLSMDEIAHLVGRARQTDAWATRPRPIELVLWPEPPVDPVSRPGAATAAIEAATAAGATVVNLRFASRSLAHHLECLEAMVRLAGDRRETEGDPA
jgi:probable F420-dependent oxidoreductase